MIYAAIAYETSDQLFYCVCDVYDLSFDSGRRLGGKRRPVELTLTFL